MKKILKKLNLFILLIAMLFQINFPLTVLAINSQSGNQITLTGSSNLNGENFVYEHGNVNIKKNGTSVTTETFEVANNDQIVITMFADDNYNSKLLLGSEELTLDNGSYSFTVDSSVSSTLTFTPSFEAEQSNVVTYDFRLNGVDFKDIENGATLTVTDNFNMDSISEFYITKIVTSSKTYTYSANDYSNTILNSSNKLVLEINTSKISNNYIKMRIQSHPSDSKYYEFYLPEINIKKSGFKGVEVTTSVMPDNYDFTTWNGVDLSATSIDNPGNVTVYYGEDTINLSNNEIKNITLVENQGVPESVINIDNQTKKVTVLSNYYNKIPLKIELNDGTIGYINVNRIGIFISSLNKGATQFYHGASADVGNNMNVDTDKDRIVAVFYHENSKSGNNYNLVVNITYEDGSTETTIAEYVGDVNNSTGDIIGSDYILWKGTENMPAKVSVTAVDANALANENTFGGATFGSSEGVIWERN